MVRQASVIIERGERPVQVTLGEAITQYQEELKSLGRAESTIHGYMIYLRKFGECGGWDRSVKIVSPDLATRFFASLSTQHTRNMALAALRGFLGWCVRMRYLPAESVAIALGTRQTRKVARKPKHYIPVGQFPALLDAAGETHPIERAAVAVALFTLCRQSEIAAIKLSDVDLAARKITVWRMKRQRHTTVAISPDLHAELIRWLRWYADQTGNMHPVTMMRDHPDWLLIPHWAYVKVRGPRGNYVGTDGDAILTPDRPPRRLEYVLKRALTNLGVVTRKGYSVDHLGEGLHTIRRSGARALLDHLEGNVGADRALIMVSKMLDHEDTKMTLRYIEMDIDKERLDDWLSGNSMYGSPTMRDVEGATVITMPAREA